MMFRTNLGALPQLSQEHCDSAWSLLNPVAWFGGCVARDVANVYEGVRYGHIPRPNELPQAPVPGVVFTGELPAITAADWANWRGDYQAALQAKEDSGSWDPTSSAFNWVVLGVGVVVLLKVIR